VRHRGRPAEAVTEQYTGGSLMVRSWRSPGHNAHVADPEVSTTRRTLRQDRCLPGGVAHVKVTLRLRWLAPQAGGLEWLVAVGVLQA
jgi:hypothetical protein